MTKKSYLEIKDFPFKNGKELIRELKKNKIVLSPWIEDIFEKKNSQILKSFYLTKYIKFTLKKI